MSPAVWLQEELSRFFGLERSPEPTPPRQSLSVADLVANDAAVLAMLVERLRERGSPRRAAAKYLAGWIGGAAAAAIGQAAVRSEGSFVVNPSEATWRLHPGGWFDGVDLGEATVTVAPGHRWSGLPGTMTIAGCQERAARSVEALVEALEPVTVALRELGGVGLGGLWAEVGDGFGSPFLYQPIAPVTLAAVSTLRELTEVPGAPWKVRPVMWTVEADHGLVCVTQKGGCCLAYTETGGEAGIADDGDQREFDELFTEPPGAPGYCSTCRHRTRQDVEARQVWWRVRERSHRLAS